MSTIFMIRLASHAGQEMHWWRFSADKQLHSSGQVPDAASLASLQPDVQDNPVIALVPACDVILRAVDLPGRLNRKTQKALPFLLEESVVDDPESLHVTVLAWASPTVHLAAVSRSLMQEWCGWLESAGLRVDKMLPDIFALPLTEGGCRWSLGEQHLIRESHWQGMTLESVLLAALPDERTSGWQSCCSETAMHIAHLPDANLLNGEWKPQRQKIPLHDGWRWPGYLLALSLLLALTLFGLERFQQYREVSRLEAQMQALYQQAFPGSPTAGDPWREFNLKAARNRGAFLSLLRALDESLPAAVTMQSLQYDAASQGLTAQLSGTSPVTLKAIEQQLPSSVMLRTDPQQSSASEITLVLKKAGLPRHLTATDRPRDVQRAQQLQQMKMLMAQQSLVNTTGADLRSLLQQTREKAQLTALSVVEQDGALTLHFEAAVPFSHLTGWLQQLEYHHGIVPQQVQLMDKGEGNVEVKRLVLTRGGAR